MTVSDPDRCADVETPIGLVRMTPQLLAGRRIHSADDVATEDNELRLTVHVDQNRRGRRPDEVTAFPQQLARLLIERGDRLIRPTHGDDDAVLVEDRAAAVAAAGQRRSV